MFFKNHEKIRQSDQFHTSFCFLESFIWGKSKCSAAEFQYILINLNFAYYQNKLYKTLDYWSWDMLNFDFLEKNLEIVSPPDFVPDFFKKRFIMLYSINLPNSIGQYVYSTWSKSQAKELNSLITKRYFKVKQEGFFITFNELLVATNFLRPQSEALKFLSRIIANQSSP